ncbi:hypothetical protein XENORESO_017868 [Xenotaenia resolanae]|uniref:Uncharacterized protein n=1 Tax=Xenotaenia resolanae TaxID=208358 RepID=A0ABV0W0Z3_9TELE
MVRLHIRGADANYRWLRLLSTLVRVVIPLPNVRDVLGVQAVLSHLRPGIMLEQVCSAFILIFLLGDTEQQFNLIPAFTFFPDYILVLQSNCKETISFSSPQSSQSRPPSLAFIAILCLYLPCLVNKADFQWVS